MEIFFYLNKSILVLETKVNIFLESKVQKKHYFFYQCVYIYEIIFNYSDTY